MSDSRDLPGCAVELSRELLVQTSLDGTIVDANAAFGRVLGWSSAELRATSFFAFVHPDDVEKTRDDVRRAIASAAPSAFSNRCRHKDGSHRWISWSAVVSDKTLYAVGHDTTAEVEALQALRECRDIASQLQRTDSIMRLTRGMGHEFNNLVQTIMGALQLVQRLIGAGRTAETGRFIESAIRAGNDAGAINQRLGALMRPHAFDPQPLSMNELVADMADLLRRALPASLKLDTDLAPDLWKTRCDPHEGRIAVLDLVFGMREVMPGAGTIGIRTRNRHRTETPAPHAPPGDHVAVEVTGSGSEAQQHDARSAFDRPDASVAHGSGIDASLTRVRRFARENGGDATVDFRNGNAISMVLYLPRHEHADAAG